ncbi:hypothetical protein C666_10835 [Thauera linaloolentis 47Lol = DSM 12138]|uniref:Uncharacterized protein n=2 Tax=Thauera linaloolentis TaxID=76112 RepID=N6Z5N9_THAL4|nr:hypothetical protein C666_10835 [Thauera linaloolentis 47Lol = DSM 12138]
MLFSALLVLGGAYAVRYGLLENGVLPRDCSLPEAQGGLCVFKTVLVQSFVHQRMGWFSLACGVLAFVLGGRRFAWAGWLSGLAGLVFYSYDPAAVGALLSLLVLARPRQGREEGRKGEGEAGGQPGDGLGVRRLG